MTPTEQGLSVTSPIIKPPDVDDRLSHYSAAPHMMINKSYSPVPGVQDNTLYSSQYPTILPSPQFIHTTLGSPSSVTSAYAPPHYPPSPSTQQPSSSHPTLRTVYLGNIASDTHISDILDQVRTGAIEMVRPFPEKNCLFLTFVDASAAAHFYYQVSNRPFSINGVDLKIGWGKPSVMPATIRLALQNGASRNVFLGSLDESVNEDVIREDLKRFGTIEHVRLIREKNIAFVHFLSIANAIKCVTHLPTEGDWHTRRVYYGKDRSSAMYAYPPYSHPPMHVQHYQVRYPYDPYTYTPSPQRASPTDMYPTNLTGVANRTIYLGNIHPDTTCEEICNVVRGGILSHIRYMVDKHIAFIAFVDPVLALHFYTQASYQGIVIKSRRLKIGWGKPSSLPGHVIQAVQSGGSRNVYLGNMDDAMTEEKLLHDFSEYGDIELVNTLKEKNCAFVNFTSIAAAIRAIEGIRTKEEYKRFRINYGKDRCGNPPRASQPPTEPTTDLLLPTDPPPFGTLADLITPKPLRLPDEPSNVLPSGIHQ